MECLGTEIVEPPVRYCATHGSRMLQARSDSPAARLYTKSRGILPIFPVTRECKVQGLNAKIVVNV